LENEERGRSFSRWLTLPVIAAVASLVLTVGLAFWRTRGGEPVPEPEPAYSGVAPRLPDGFAETAEFVAPGFGQSEPAQLIDLGAAVTGVIERLHVERGDDVESGQVVAELEAGTERAAVEVARARAEMKGEIEARQASLDLEDQRRERARELFEHRALSLDLKQEIETEAELAKLELKRAREQRELARLELTRSVEALKRRTVRSPIDGVVVERMLSRGEVVDQEPIVRIAQLDPLRIEVILPAAMFGSVQLGMQGVVVPEHPGDKVHAAVVTIVDRVVDSASGTFGVQLELPNPDHAIAGGLHCRVSFLRE
jgi:RND family efflux transporter MFP subunit